MAKNKDGGGGAGEGAVGGGSGGQQPRQPSRPGQPKEPGRGLRGRHTHRGTGRVREKEGERGREREAGMAGEGGLPTSDPADGGHMAAASQIKRLRLGGSAITAV